MEDCLFFNWTEQEIDEFNPVTAARGVIKLLTELVVDLQGNGKGQFNEQFLKFVVGYGIKARDLTKLDEALPDFVDRPFEIYAEATNTFFVHAATVFAVDAIAEFQAGRTQHAWILALQAERYLGLAMGTNPAIKIPKAVKSDQGLSNALRKHEENRKIKAYAWKYYQDHISEFESLKDAAKKIAGKIVPMKYKTVLRWLTEFHKENPSIQKPSRPARQ
jgi:hypothetical protein